MTLLSICQQVARLIPVAAPTSIIENTNDDTALLLLACAQKIGEDIARRPQGGWISMIEEYDFQTSAVGPIIGSVANTGPGGVARITGLSSTVGISPLTFYAFGPGLPNNSIVQTVDSGTQVTLNLAATGPFTAQPYTFGKSDYPLPADFERPIDNTAWDRSRFWAMRGPQSPQQWQMYKSSVIGKATIERRYRFREIGGQTLFSIDPVPLDNQGRLVIEYVSNGWCQSSLGVRQTMWEADTDTGVVDEYLIGLGVLWYVLKRLGLSCDEEKDSYERALSRAMAADGGAAVLSIAPLNTYGLLSPWQVPDTGYGH